MMKLSLASQQYWKTALIRAAIPLSLLLLSAVFRVLSVSHTVLSACAVLILIMLPPSRSHSLFSANNACILCYILSSMNYGVGIWDILLVAAVLIAAENISGRIRQQIEKEQSKNVSNAERTSRLNELNALLLSTHGTDDILKLLLSFIHKACGYPLILFEVSSSGVRKLSSDPPGTITFKRDVEAVLHAAKTQQISGVGTEYAPSSVYRCYPVNISKETFGVIAVLLGNDGYEPDIFPFIGSLLQRANIALERQRLIDTQQKLSIEKQLEYMRSNFLRAISHDLRSPLAAIAAACYALEQTPGMSKSNLRLISDIQEESVWLTQMVENLLSITRLDTESPKLNLTSEAVEEIVGEAAYKCRIRFPDLNLEVRVPDQVMIIQMDAMLITQVILNLVENALKYGGSSKKVLLTVSRDNADAIFSIRDYGLGILPEMKDTLFSGNGIARDDSRRGFGIGLSICKTIVSAHRGKISAKNCIDGGAEFIFTLPLEEPEHENR